jgi:hypothetical protein
MRRNAYPIPVPDRPFVMAPVRTDRGDWIVIAVAGGGQMPTPLSVFRGFHPGGAERDQKIHDTSPSFGRSA